MTQQKLTEKGRANRAKYCIDCRYATTHHTGSTIWISCKFQSGWRIINSICNLPTEKTSFSER